MDLEMARGMMQMNESVDLIVTDIRDQIGDCKDTIEMSVASLEALIEILLSMRHLAVTLYDGLEGVNDALEG